MYTDQHLPAGSRFGRWSVLARLLPATALAVVVASASIRAQDVVGSALLEEDFASADAMSAWQPVVGATTGDGPASEFAWDTGSLRLSGQAGTGSWMSMTRTIDTGGASWIRLVGRIRTDGVDVSEAEHLNCNFYVLHDGGLVGTRIVTGTTDWTEVRRQFELPIGTQQATVGIFLSIPGQAWFDDLHVEATAAPVWTETPTGHYSYQTLPGDTIPAEAIAFNDTSHQLVSEFLGVTEPDLVVYFKYPDLATKEELTGNAGNAHRDGQTIHSVWATDRHEIVHVLADAWGDPPALIGEGLAVYLSGGWQGQPVREYAGGLLQSGEWIGLDAIFTSWDFRQHPDLQTYAVAGALVEWIETNRGREILRGLYGALVNNNDRANNQQVFETMLGGSLTELDAELRAWVQQVR